jgi:two-component system chemotaxis response regulator CheB
MTARKHDIMVIGGSAGAVEALVEIARGLPPGFPAAIHVVLHLPPASRLPELLAHAGPLPAAYAGDGDPVQPGRIVVAPPGKHLLLERGTMKLEEGPRENGHRPAVDPLFRSAAISYGPRVVAIVLSGMGDDGSSGLLSVRSAGGKIIVQDPETALYRQMPESALDGAGGDWSAPPAQIPGIMARLARTTIQGRGEGFPVQAIAEQSIVEGDKRDQAEGRRAGEPSLIACPECGGVLWEIREKNLLKYRCHVGHAYTLDSLVGKQGDQLECALWSAVRMFEERAILARRQARRAMQNGFERVAEGFEESARECQEDARLLREHFLQKIELQPPEAARVGSSGQAGPG